VLWKALPGGGEEPVRFRFEPGPGALALDPPMDGLPRKSPELPDAQKAFLESRIRIAAPFPVARVSLSRFLCRQCGELVPADSANWSYSLCIGCSMDNASEMAERED
jgi:hypothetical protein